MRWHLQVFSLPRNNSLEIETETKLSRKQPGVFFLSQNMLNKEVQLIIASSKRETLNAYAAMTGLDPHKNQLIGLNPEKRVEEPEVDDPKLATAAKLAAVEEIAKGLGLFDAVIAASDVICSYYKNDKKMIYHRPAEYRNTTSRPDQIQTYTPEDIDLLEERYKNGSKSGWDVSYGFSTPLRRNNTVYERNRLVTQPWTVFAEFPKLSRSVLEQFWNPRATPLVDLVGIAADQGIKMAAQSLESDKLIDIKPEVVQQAIVNKAPRNREAINSLLRQDRIDREYLYEKLSVLPIAYKELVLSSQFEKLMAAA